MNNPLAGAFELKTADTTYRLVIDMNTMCLIEEEKGVAALEFLEKLQTEVRFTNLRFMLWAALQEHHADEVKDVKAAGKIVSQIGLVNIQGLITDALNKAMPTPEEVAGAVGDPQAPPATADPPSRETGEPSGSTSETPGSPSALAQPETSGG